MLGATMATTAARETFDVVVVGGGTAGLHAAGELAVLGLRVVNLKSTFQKMTRLVRDVSQKAAKQIDFIKKSYDSAITNTKELADLYTKGQAEAVTALPAEAF